MAEEEKFDAIIIGAGPAGSACAYVLAREGKNVLLVERGNTAGCKNVTGGRLYSYALEMIEPGLTSRAPMQRKVVREQVMLLGPRSAVTTEYLDYDWGDGIPQSYTVLRALFDEWFAGEAEAQGAVVATGIRVDNLIEQSGKIVGIIAGEDEMYADVVIAADGVNSLIAQKAGLRADITAASVGIGVKEVVEMPDELISARFNLQPDEAAARVILGCTEGISGGGFIYTNKGSISIGAVFNPDQAGAKGRSVHDVFQDFKLHPAVLPLIAGGKSVEYGAHLVPELGLGGMPSRLYREGLLVVGDAAGFCINSGTILRGIDLAIVSGLAAANAVVASKTSQAETGSIYMKELERLGLMPTMKLYAGWPRVLENPRMFTQYPDMVNEMFKSLFCVDGNIPGKLSSTMFKIMRTRVGIGAMLADGWKAFRAI